jgi:hypothetical protein
MTDVREEAPVATAAIFIPCEGVTTTSKIPPPPHLPDVLYRFPLREGLAPLAQGITGN